jgi:hypothetical protein
MRFLRIVAEHRTSDRKSNEGIRELEVISLLHNEGGLQVTISVGYSWEIEMNIDNDLSIDKMKDWKEYNRRNMKLLVQKII